MNHNFSNRLKDLLKQVINESFISQRTTFKPITETTTNFEVKTVATKGDDDYKEYVTPDYLETSFKKGSASARRAGQNKVVEPLSVKFAKRFLDIHGVSHGETPTGATHGKNVSRLASYVRGLIIRNEVPISHLKSPESKVWQHRFKGVSGLQDMITGTTTPPNPAQEADTAAWMTRAKDAREKQERMEAELKPKKVKTSSPSLVPVSPVQRAALQGKLIKRDIKEDLNNQLRKLLKKNYNI